jgi:deoxyribose-phosphate aldolase
VREACGPTHLKVILETAELATLDNTLRAAWLAMLAGPTSSRPRPARSHPLPRRPWRW